MRVEWVVEWGGYTPCRTYFCSILRAGRMWKYTIHHLPTETVFREGIEYRLSEARRRCERFLSGVPSQADTIGGGNDDDPR